MVEVNHKTFPPFSSLELFFCIFGVAIAMKILFVVGWIGRSGGRAGGGGNCVKLVTFSAIGDSFSGELCCCPRPQSLHPLSKQSNADQQREMSIRNMFFAHNKGGIGISIQCYNVELKA